MTISAAKKHGVDEAEIIAWCKRYISDAINISETEIDVRSDLETIGLDSAIATSMMIDMEAWLGVEIPVAVMFEQPNVAGIAAVAVRLVERAGLRS